MQKLKTPPSKALESIAKSIGMSVKDGSWRDGPKWDDSSWVGIANHHQTADLLMQHLLTGDRPLRILKAYNLSLINQTDLWFCTDLQQEPIPGSNRSDPAVAILHAALQF